MSLTDLTDDKLKQLEQQLKMAYDSIFSKDDQKFKPKKVSMFNIIENNFELISITIVGTMLLMKFSQRYELPKRTPFDFE
jgi:hypothetical protein